MKNLLPKFHGLALLPAILEITGGQLTESWRQLKNLEACQQRPQVLNRKTVDCIIKLYREQNKLTPYFVAQCKKWRALNPNTQQVADIQKVEQNTVDIEKINHQILFLAEHYQDPTMEMILEKNPVEVVDYWMGNSHSPFSDDPLNNAFGMMKPDKAAIKKFYEIKPSRILVKPISLTQLYQDYKNQRQLLADFHQLVYQDVLSTALEAAQELGNIDPEDGVAIVENDAEMNLFYDYMTLYRLVGKTRFIVNWLKKHSAKKTVANSQVVDAYCTARFTALRIDKNLDNGAMEVVDIMTGQPYILIDQALSDSKEKGLFILCSLLMMGDYVMTSGSGIPIDGRSSGGQMVLTLLAQHQAILGSRDFINKKIAGSVREIYSFCLCFGALLEMDIPSNRMMTP